MTDPGTEVGHMSYAVEVSLAASESHSFVFQKRPSHHPMKHIKAGRKAGWRS